MEPSYRYFAAPHQFSTYTPDAQQCGLCGNVRPGYSQPFRGGWVDSGPYRYRHARGYRLETIPFVCEECMLAGRLREIRSTTNTGNNAALLSQLEALQPRLSYRERVARAGTRTGELVYATPTLLTYETFAWPVHCGDYCRFLKMVGQPDLDDLAQDGDGQAFFEAHAASIQDSTQAREVWAKIRQDRPQHALPDSSVDVCLFQCLTCGEYIIHWDQDPE